nr:ribonuclease H-like domain-containing protein [Tanacetum cinerariifolium]
MTRQNYVLKDVLFDQLYDHLSQFEPHVNESKEKKASRNHDPLTLVANYHAHSSNSHAKPSYSHLPQPYYVTYPSSVIDYKDNYQREIQRDAYEDKLTTTNMLLARGVKTIIAPATAEEKAQRRLELKERNTLLTGIPNEHQLMFNFIKDAKSLLQAVEKRFGGNAATKKTQRNLLKQQYENFIASSSEVRDGFKVADGYANNEGKEILKNTERKFSMNSNETIRALKNQENKNRESTRRIVPIETPASLALVSCDRLGNYDYSDQAEDGPNNFALMAYSSRSSNSEVSAGSNVCRSKTYSL